MVDTGILEMVGKKAIPSRRLMARLGEKGKYTRMKGLDRPAQRALLLQHIRESEDGARFEDIQQVLPGVPDGTIKDLLQKLKTEELIHPVGKTRAARWFSGPPANPPDDLS